MIYDAVVFDLDGTLLNTLKDLANAGNYSLQKLGLPPHPEPAYKQMVGNGIPKLIERMLPVAVRNEQTIEAAKDIFDAYYEAHMLDETKPYAGIEDLLQRLAAQQTKRAVLSNKADKYTQFIANKYFNGIFDVVLGLEKPFLPKPDPASLHHVLCQLDVDPKKALYCGDSNTDIYTAKAAGIKSCGVLWGFRDRAELEAAGADHIVSRPAQILEIVAGSFEP